MTRRKTRVFATASRSRWFTVERWMTCLGTGPGPKHKAVKAHDVPVGTHMRWSKRSGGTATCADCLALHGIFEPGREPAEHVDA